jgi:hypothetical protein
VEVPVTPSVSFGSPIPGKPFVLVVPTDHEDLAAYLTPEALRVLVASGDAALVEHRQATCPGHDIDTTTTFAGTAVGYCQLCDVELVQEADGSVVPVGEGT